MTDITTINRGLRDIEFLTTRFKGLLEAADAVRQKRLDAVAAQEEAHKAKIRVICRGSAAWWMGNTRRSGKRKPEDGRYCACRFAGIATVACHSSADGYRRL
jgi:hypothetical protein